MMPRPSTKTLAIAAVLALLGVGGWGAWSSWSAWASASSVESRLAAIRAAGDPTSIAAFGAPERALRDDADAILEEIAAEVVDLGAALRAPKLMAATADAAPGAAEALFDAHPEIVPALLEAASRPTYSHRFAATSSTARLVDEIVDRTKRFGAMVRILSTWSAILRARGDRDGAVVAGVAALRISEHVGRDPGFTSTLASVSFGYASIRDITVALLSGPVSDASRDALDAQLARFDGAVLLRHALTTERAFSITFARAMPPNPVATWLGVKDGKMPPLLDLYDGEIATIGFPYREAQDASRAFSAELSGKFWRETASATLPAVRSAREAVARLTAMVRSLRVLNALQRLDLDAPPADLAALGLPPEATVDPFIGEPLIVKKLPEGWLVYSVGSNFIDDGGSLDRVRDDGVGPVVAPAAAESP